MPLFECLTARNIPFLCAFVTNSFGHIFPPYWAVIHSAPNSRSAVPTCARHLEIESGLEGLDENGNSSVFSASVLGPLHTLSWWFLRPQGVWHEIDLLKRTFEGPTMRNHI